MAQQPPKEKLADTAREIVAIKARLPMPSEAQASGVTPQQWRVLVDAIWPSAKTAEAVCMAIDYCKARHLDPFKRPVHIVPVWNSNVMNERGEKGAMVETVWPGINELQVTAARTGNWAGMDEPKWGPTKFREFKGSKKDQVITVNSEYPEWCSVTVYRMIGGQRCAFSEPVFWDEAYARAGRNSELPNEMWQKRPRGQLHKVAKAASLRAAFPEEMGNDYTAEEMEGKELDSGGVVIEGSAEPARTPAAAEPVPSPKRDAAIVWRDRVVAEYAAAGSYADCIAVDARHATNFRNAELKDRTDVTKPIEEAREKAHERFPQPDDWPGPDVPPTDQVEIEGEERLEA